MKYLLSKVVSSSIQYLTLYFCLSVPLFKNPQSPTHPNDDPILNVQQQIVVFHISAKPLSMPSSCDCKKRIALDADSKESTDGMPLALEYFSLFLFPIPNPAHFWLCPSHLFLPLCCLCAMHSPDWFFYALVSWTSVVHLATNIASYITGQLRFTMCFVACLKYA